MMEKRGNNYLEKVDNKEINVKKDKKRKTLENNIKIKNEEEVPVLKTAEILKQMNKYLSEEKKKLK